MTSHVTCVTRSTQQPRHARCARCAQCVRKVYDVGKTRIYTHTLIHIRVHTHLRCYQVTSEIASLRKACDAGKTRGFALIPRYCSPDDKFDYVSPWAPPAPAKQNAAKEGAAAAPPAAVSVRASFDTVLQCGMPAQALHGPGTAEVYHCFKENSVSGSYGNYGFFQGHFENRSSLTAFINFVQVCFTGASGLFCGGVLSFAPYQSHAVYQLCPDRRRRRRARDAGDRGGGRDVHGKEVTAYMQRPGHTRVLWSGPEQVLAPNSQKGNVVVNL